MAKRKPSQIVQVGTRMPENLRAFLEKSAKERGLSINAEIVRRLEESRRQASAEEILAEAQALLNEVRSLPKGYVDKDGKFNPLVEIQSGGSEVDK